MGFSMVLKRLPVGLAVVLAGLGLRAATLPIDMSWDPDKEVPAPVFIGPSTPEEEKLAVDLRQELVGELAHWQRYGLPNPTNIQGLYIITDVRHMKVEEVLHEFNPEIHDVKAHVAAQFDRLVRSKLVAVLAKAAVSAEPNMPIEELKTNIASQIFSFYSQNRYTFSIPDLANAIATGKTVEEVYGGKAPTYPDQDNAFYARFMRYDLSEILPLADKTDEAALQQASTEAKLKAPNVKSASLQDVIGASFKDLVGQMPSVINIEKFAKLSSQANRSIPRIVILPRNEQETLGLKVSTLKDPMVSRHELGHHIAHTIHDGIHRLIDEAMADYLAAAPEGNPKIGEFFAKASGEIAKELESKSPRSVEQWAMAHEFAKMSEAGLLRDLSDETNIDQIARKFSLAGDYDAGNPLRTFLWKLRFSSGLPEQTVDRMVLQVLKELDGLPTLMSSRTSYLLHVRSMWRQAKDALLVMLEKGSIQRWVVQTQQDQIDEYTEKMWTDEITRLAAAGEISQDDAKSRLEKGPAGIPPEIRKLGRNRYLAEMSDVISVRANQVVAEDQARAEARDIRGRVMWQKIGLGARPALQADYVIPEFLRAMYRVAQTHSPEAALAVRRLAERTMNSDSFEVRTESGAREIVFAKNLRATLNPIARARAKTLMSRLEALRADRQRLSTMENVDAQLQALTKAYSTDLERVQEFERTGSVHKLYVAHPVIDVIQSAGQKILEGVKARSCQKVFTVMAP